MEASSSKFVDQLVVPGDVILELSNLSSQTLKLGDGLRQDGDSICVMKAGKLRFMKPNEYWVESSQKRGVAVAANETLPDQAGQQHSNDGDEWDLMHEEEAARLLTSAEALVDEMVRITRQNARRQDQLGDIMLWQVQTELLLTAATGGDPPPYPPTLEYPDLAHEEESLNAVLAEMVRTAHQSARHLDRLDDIQQWRVQMKLLRMAAAGVDPPPFPLAREYPVLDQVGQHHNHEGDEWDITYEKEALRLLASMNTMLDELVRTTRQNGLRQDRFKDIELWQVQSQMLLMAAAGMDPPPFPPAREYPDDP